MQILQIHLKRSLLFQSLFYLLLIGFVTSSNAYADNCLVKYVIDGDTFVLSNGTRVRLASIDAPETAKKNIKAGFFADEATTCLRKMVLNKKVVIKPVKRNSKSHDRIVAWVFFENTNISYEMVKKGFAYLYYIHGNDRDIQDKILEAQNKAILSQNGMWLDVFKKVLNKKYVGNSRSRRFSEIGSKYERSVSNHNRVYFKGMQEAFKAGYAPIRHDNIWPDSELE